MTLNMALEKEILARIQYALACQDSDSEQLYKALLGDLKFRESQGLIDPPDMLSMSQLADPVNRTIVDKVNPILDPIADGCTIKDFRGSLAYQVIQETLTAVEKPKFNKAFNMLSRYADTYGDINTFGDIRRLGFDELVHLRNIGPKGARIIIGSFRRKIDEPLTT